MTSTTGSTDAQKTQASLVSTRKSTLRPSDAGGSTTSVNTRGTKEGPNTEDPEEDSDVDPRFKKLQLKFVANANEAERLSNERKAKRKEASLKSRASRDSNDSRAS